MLLDFIKDLFLILLKLNLLRTSTIFNKILLRSIHSLFDIFAKKYFLPFIHTMKTSLPSIGSQILRNYEVNNVRVR